MEIEVPLRVARYCSDVVKSGNFAVHVSRIKHESGGAPPLSTIANDKVRFDFTATFWSTALVCRFSRGRLRPNYRFRGW